MTARLSFMMIGLAALAAACSSSPPQANLTLDVDRHKPLVTQEVARLDLLPAYDGRVAPEDYPAIAAFLREYRDAGHGPLVVAAPSGENPAALAEAIRGVAASSGVSMPDIAVTVSAFDGGSPFNLTFVRYRAHAPECGRVWPSLGQTARSDMYENFGCANAANLAAMIVDPADLLAPRPMEPADATRRVNALNAYRAGELGGGGEAGGGAQPTAAAGGGGGE